MRFGVLGQIEVLGDDDRPIELGGPKARRLLACLLSDVGRAVSTDRLAEAVWYGEDEPVGASTLASHVSRLRRRLRHEVEIDRQAGGYVLRVDTNTIDAVYFDDLVRRADESNDPAMVHALLGQALKLWRGDAFEDFGEEGWVRPDVRRLDELRAGAAERYAEAQLELGLYGRAIVELPVWIERWPYRERLRSLLMLALYRSGRQPEALRTFHRFRSEIDEQLGLAPTEELSALERRIAVGDPGLLARPRTERLVRGFRLHERIGIGAIGVIHRATQLSVDREVAIKILRPKSVDDPDFTEHFEAEAQLVANLEHPHIVPIHDYWRDHTGIYLVMRYLPAGSLADRLRVGPVPATDVALWISQLAGAIDVVHRAKVCHRQIKPGNVLLDPHGNAYLSDFGLAAGRRASRPGAPASCRAADIRGLALVAYEALTRVEISSGPDGAEHHPGRLPPTHAVQPAIPEAVDTLLRATFENHRHLVHPTASRFAASFIESFGFTLT